MKPTRPARIDSPFTSPASARPRPDLGSFTLSSAARTSDRSGRAALSIWGLSLLWSRKGSTYRVDRAGLHACVARIDTESPRTRGMPWNDNANPGPWGSPPGDEGERKDVPARRPQDGGGPRGPRPGPGGPDFNAGFEQLRRRLSEFFRGGGRGLRPGMVGAI